ncbi:MAG: rRNA maturation RNase YbeY [Dehalococcoidia bacterium]|nr:MAG: rRNA maturation RNase YbeY [Dehalococcoidia bacterium]
MEINVLIEEGLGAGIDGGWLKRVAEHALTSQGVSADVELGLVIAGGGRVRELNKSYLGRDEPTDVLAFAMVPTQVETSPPAFVIPPDGVLHLGEVIISYPQAVAQAGEQGHSVKKEIAILIIHGLLHLLGYEHDKTALRKQMTAREAEILESISTADLG